MKWVGIGEPGGEIPEKRDSTGPRKDKHSAGWGGRGTDGGARAALCVHVATERAAHARGGLVQLRALLALPGHRHHRQHPARWRDETCPVSTGGGTRRVQSVHERREGGGSARCGQSRWTTRDDKADHATELMQRCLPPPPRTKWTRRVPHPVLIGHAASLSLGAPWRTRRSSCSDARRNVDPIGAAQEAGPERGAGWAGRALAAGAART